MLYKENTAENGILESTAEEMTLLKHSQPGYLGKKRPLLPIYPIPYYPTPYSVLMAISTAPNPVKGRAGAIHPTHPESLKNHTDGAAASSSLLQPFSERCVVWSFFRPGTYGSSITSFPGNY